MKRLLIVSLVLGVLVVFSGVANAQSWWMSEAINGATIKINYYKPSGAGLAIGGVSGKFAGYLVVNSTTATLGAAIEQVFLCGTVTVPQAGIILDVWLDFEGQASFSFQVTEHPTEPSPGKTDKEAGHVIAVGIFQDQDSGLSGPAFLEASLALKEDGADNIESVFLKGEVVGGYGQPAGSTRQFVSSSISTNLTPYTGKTPLTCVKGVVVVP